MKHVPWYQLLTPKQRAEYQSAVKGLAQSQAKERLEGAAEWTADRLINIAQKNPTLWPTVMANELNKLNSAIAAERNIGWNEGREHERKCSEAILAAEREKAQKLSETVTGLHRELAAERERAPLTLRQLRFDYDQALKQLAAERKKTKIAQGTISQIPMFNEAALNAAIAEATKPLVEALEYYAGMGDNIKVAKDALAAVKEGK